MGLLRTKSLSLPHQLATLRANWPEGETRLTQLGLAWTGPLVPSVFSRTYMVRVSYQSPQHLPMTQVLSPSLDELAGGREIPHMYSQKKGELCLFTPKFHEWTGRMRLSHSILPWAELWLYYFEDWLATGDWQGGGTDHPTPRTISTYSAPFLRSLR
jgi:hypothetical protein